MAVAHAKSVPLIFCLKIAQNVAQFEFLNRLLLNRIADTYQSIAGGALGWDAIILTGGCSALLYNRLLSILNHAKVILADEMDSLHHANVRGGLKLWRLYEALQTL